MIATLKIVEILGGQAVLQGSVSNLNQLRARIREGLPYEALEVVMEKLAVRREEVSDVLALPLRTLTRRKKEKRLRPDESDRLFRLARIVAHTVEVLGDEEKAALWLHRSNRALGGSSPLDLLDTDLGARQVEEVLGRIAHGVYS